MITFSLDGRFAYPSTGDVINTESRQIVATLEDEQGPAVQSQKLLEIVFSSGQPVKAGIIVTWGVTLHQASIPPQAQEALPDTPQPEGFNLFASPSPPPHPPLPLVPCPRRRRLSLDGSHVVRQMTSHAMRHPPNVLDAA